MERGLIPDRREEWEKEAGASLIGWEISDWPPKRQRRSQEEKEEKEERRSSDNPNRPYIIIKKVFNIIIFTTNWPGPGVGLGQVRCVGMSFSHPRREAGTGPVSLHSTLPGTEDFIPDENELNWR